VPRVGGSRVLYRDGLPIATSVAGEVALLVTLDAAQAQAARRALALEPSLRVFELAAQPSA
jgi:ATP-dependent Lhr-like helicase